MILYVQKNSKNKTEFSYTLFPASPVVNILFIYGITFVKINEPILM